MSMTLIIGIAVIAAIISVTLKGKSPEMALVVSLAAGLFLVGLLLPRIVLLYDWVKELMEHVGAGGQYAQILFRCMGICFVTQIACDTCRDMGESAIASKVEAAGKITVLLVSLPLFQNILTIAGSLIG